MSGHSKWSTIKRKKAANDARRGKLFTKLLREVTIAARLGGGDPDANPRLRSAIQDAKANNVPNDNLDRAVKKGTGELEGDAIEEVTYEGYGPGGVAVFVEAMTDNRNRTVSDVRHLFSKHGGNLGQDGCVAWMFDRRGYFLLPSDAVAAEVELVELAMAVGAEDFATGSDGYELFTDPTAYLEAKEALEARGVALETAELAMVPQSQVELEAAEATQTLQLLESLEDQDDVQNVWSNFDFDESALEPTH